jgi:hypothetical protein
MRRRCRGDEGRRGEVEKMVNKEGARRQGGGVEEEGD